MDKAEPPVVLELAPVPREKAGPFLLLGVDKDATPKEIEAAWAQRVIMARKGVISTPLENVNWAREVCNDPERRVRADVTSLNADSAERTLQQLEKRYGLGGPNWQPLDRESDLPDIAAAVPFPASAAVRARIDVPLVPEDMPAVKAVLGKLVETDFDPWKLPL
jgi:hypothetical protein